MDHQVLLNSIKTLLMNLRSASSERAEELFRDLPGRGGFVPQLTNWLEKNRTAFPEPFTAQDLDSVNDPGVDVLLVGAHSSARVGFQIKSENDLRSTTFTRDLKAQILDAQRVGVELFVVVFSCTPSKKNLSKVRYWQNYALTHSRPQIFCLPPEKAAGLYDNFSLPIEPIIPSGRTWADFFQIVGQSSLASRYLDTWPTLPPDKRFLPPEEVFKSIRQSLQDNQLTFLIGAPAAGKTFTSLQCLWEAFQAGRPVYWITATDAEITDGPIPGPERGLPERTELRRRIDACLRRLGNPRDNIDIMSRVLAPNALVYIEDPFGKSESEYDISLASYNFFDLHRFVEELERSSVRTGCRMLISSRESLFQRWHTDLKAKALIIPKCTVIRLPSGAYSWTRLYDHAMLLGRARGFSDPEAMSTVLADNSESPYEVDLLVRSLTAQDGEVEAEKMVSKWEGDLFAKIEGRIAPRDERDTLLLLLIAASTSQYRALHSPLNIYSKLHNTLRLEGDAKSAFRDSLQRLLPFLDPPKYGKVDALPFVPNHTVIREAVVNHVTAGEYRPLLCRIAIALSKIRPNAIPARRKGKRLSLSDIYEPNSDQISIGHYLLSLGIALEGARESNALEKIIFDTRDVRVRGYCEIMLRWHLLSEPLRKRLLDGLQQAAEKDMLGVRETVAILPRTHIEPAQAWRLLESLLEDPQRGCQRTITLQFTWTYLFLHLAEVPQSLLDRLGAWATEDPDFFLYTMDEGLLLHWDEIPDLWRRSLFHTGVRRNRNLRERLVATIAKHWNRAPQVFRELFDAIATSSDPSSRALAGYYSLFYAAEHPELEYFAFETRNDSEAAVFLETFGGGMGDEAHCRFARMLLDIATPGVAAAIMLDLLGEKIRDEVCIWEREILTQCEHLGANASKAAIALAIFGEARRAKDLGYKTADSPFGEPEIVRAAWLWSHLNSKRVRPPLSDAELEELLRGFREPKIRSACVAYASYHVSILPESFSSLLGALGTASSEDAEAIRLGAEWQQNKRIPAFLVYELVN